MNVFKALGDFDGDPAAKKSANNSLAAGQKEVSPSELRHRNFFEDTEEARSEEGSDGGGSND